MTEVVPVDEKTPAESSQAIAVYRSRFLAPAVPHGLPTYDVFMNKTFGKIPLRHISFLLMTGSLYNPQISGQILLIRQALGGWMRNMELSYPFRDWAVRVANGRLSDSFQFMISSGHALWNIFERLVDLASKRSLGQLSNAEDAFWLISSGGRFHEQTDTFFRELVKEFNENLMGGLLAWNFASASFFPGAKRAMEMPRLFQPSM